MGRRLPDFDRWVPLTSSADRQVAMVQGDQQTNGGIPIDSRGEHKPRLSQASTLREPLMWGGFAWPYGLVFKLYNCFLVGWFVIGLAMVIVQGSDAGPALMPIVVVGLPGWIGLRLLVRYMVRRRFIRERMKSEPDFDFPVADDEKHIARDVVESLGRMYRIEPELIRKSDTQKEFSCCHLASFHAR